jgi:transcriptional regulator GlxA family with amidase domain
MNSQSISAGILIFNDVQTMDFAAPLEVFDQAKFAVFTVAKTVEPVMTSSGQKLIPSHDFSNHPPIEILVISVG